MEVVWLVVFWFVVWWLVQARNGIREYIDMKSVCCGTDKRVGKL